MDAKRILKYLRQLAKNNNRTWFLEHKPEYDAIRADFEQGVEQAIRRIVTFDPSIIRLTVKDCTYRFYRDTRFSPDKSPYKRHFGAYLAAHGKKAFHGGYYIHVEPGQCMLACGTYYLPMNILTACRNEIMANIDEWLRAVDNPDFLRLFGRPGRSETRGFGLEHLKKCPAGFPADYPHIDYLRMKDYCCWVNVEDSFFEGDEWLDTLEKVFTTAKPMLDFINGVVDDYES